MSTSTLRHFGSGQLSGNTHPQRRHHKHWLELLASFHNKTHTQPDEVAWPWGLPVGQGLQGARAGVKRGVGCTLRIDDRCTSMLGAQCTTKPYHFARAVIRRAACSSCQLAHTRCFDACAPAVRQKKNIRRQELFYRRPRALKASCARDARPFVRRTAGDMAMHRHHACCSGALS